MVNEHELHPETNVKLDISVLKLSPEVSKKFNGNLQSGLSQIGVSLS